MYMLALTVAFLLFMANMERGRLSMHFRRCVRCNAHPWDSHAKDCPHRDKY